MCSQLTQPESDTCHSLLARTRNVVFIELEDRLGTDMVLIELENRLRADRYLMSPNGLFHLNLDTVKIPT